MDYYMIRYWLILYTSSLLVIRQWNSHLMKSILKLHSIKTNLFILALDNLPDLMFIISTIIYGYLIALFFWLPFIKLMTLIVCVYWLAYLVYLNILNEQNWEGYCLRIIILSMFWNLIDATVSYDMVLDLANYLPFLFKNILG